MLKNFLTNHYIGLKFSFSYFSILPITFKTSNDLSQKEVLSSMLFFLPLVGLVLGSGTVVLFSFLEHLTWYGAIISAVFYMLLYGFLHTEAVIDVADAIYASHSKKDAYLIIKEPTVGAMGVLYAIAFVLLKISGIVFLLMHNMFTEFIAILMSSRLSLLALFKIHTFRSSFATVLKESLTMPYLIGSFILFTLIGSFINIYFIVILLSSILFSMFISYSIKSKIGFVNGDVLGATLESVEILLFLIIIYLGVRI